MTHPDRRLRAGAALLAVFLITALGACSDGTDTETTEVTEATTTTAETTTTSTTLSAAERQEQREAARPVECAAWDAIDSPIAIADSGEEPGRTQLLDFLNVYEAETFRPEEGDSPEAWYYYFDPIVEYVAFGAGDRDAFLVFVGTMNERCR